MCIRWAQRGVTLLELIIAIVIVGISLAAVLSVFVITTQHSADPMVRQQAQMIAESYLDEILIKRFNDPDTNSVCPANEGSRNLYDNVCDYNTLPDTVVRDQAGNAIAALSAYNVTVTGPNNTAVTLDAYRTNYECNTVGDPECKPAT